ncbi:MAG: transposase [Muribaculaceae bacterium]|nr:transposase [Muribaculaceae bacterium]
MQIFRDPADCVQYLSYLDSVQQPERFEVLAYCLMGNHVHLLARTGKGSAAGLETATKSLGVRYAAHYNRRYDRVGPLFQGRYKSQPVDTVGYFLRVLRYIHNNPVAAGLCAAPGDYQWSSWRDYFAPAPDRLCAVHTEHALRLRPLDWLRDWHAQAEPNARGFLEDEAARPAARLTDADAAGLIRILAGCQPHEAAGLPETKKQNLFRALLCQEGFRVAQLSRLTGLPKGELRRY